MSRDENNTADIMGELGQGLQYVVKRLHVCACMCVPPLYQESLSECIPKVSNAHINTDYFWSFPSTKKLRSIIFGFINRM